jgi:hypothetical protein
MRWFADDLLKLTDQLLVVIDFDPDAHGDPAPGA